MLALALAVLFGGLTRFDPSACAPADGKQTITTDHRACPVHRSTDRVGRSSDLWRLAFGFCRYELLASRDSGWGRQRALACLSGDVRGWLATALASLHDLHVKLQV